MKTPENSKSGRKLTAYRSVAMVYLVASMAVACGGGGGGAVSTPVSPTPTATPTPSTTPPTTTAPPPAQASPVTFRVDGTATAVTSANGSFANGILSIGGTDTSRSTTIGFALTPTAAGVGTYTLGPQSSANAQLLVGNPASGWQAGVGIGSGTIIVTSLTSTNASGTFTFSMAAVPGTGATGTKSITEGVFNVTLTTATPPSATPSGGSTFSTLIDGVPWTSSLSRRATLTNNILAITGQDTNLRVITLAVPISAGLLIPPSGPATVSLDFTPGIHGVVTMVLGSQNWDNGHDGASGTVTITGLSASRVTGTFTVTLVNNPVNVAPVPTARLTSGQFDMALERF